MFRLKELGELETSRWRKGDLKNFQWQRAMSTHPHMMLGYPIPPMLKRYVAESVAFMDETMAIKEMPQKPAAGRIILFKENGIFTLHISLSTLTYIHSTTVYRYRFTYWLL